MTASGQGVREIDLEPLAAGSFPQHRRRQTCLYEIGAPQTGLRALAAADLSLGQIDVVELVELNEAASRSSPVPAGLGIDAERLNVNGGHDRPRLLRRRLTGTLVRELRRRGGRHSIATPCASALARVWPRSLKTQ